MNIEPRPFPIPVVAFGPGSQHEEETLEYLRMPAGMETYRPPQLPDPEVLAGQRGALKVLAQVFNALEAAQHGDTPPPVPLAGLAEGERLLVNQVLGEGDVSALRLAGLGQGEARIQESVYTGVWRVVDEAGDRIEVGALPRLLLDAARDDGAAAAVPPLETPPGVVNASSIVKEVEDVCRRWQAGAPTHVVNLTLLPMTPDDIAWLDHVIGTGRVQILSRGYGNCRITNACRPNTWRVVYYNSTDEVILNTVEITERPDVACAAVEDLEDSAARLAEVMAWVAA
ncbi:MAG: hydrogenase expression/formation protein [Burkholderiales bacterium]|nr:hydrogenase expression/formation protein [Burkholderiales bacterium]